MDMLWLLYETVLIFSAGFALYAAWHFSNTGERDLALMYLGAAAVISFFIGFS